MESGAACVNSFLNQSIKGGLEVKVSNYNSKGQIDLPFLGYLSEAPGPHITEAPAHPCPLLRHSQQQLRDHPRYPAAEEWLRENVHTHTMECRQP